MRRVAITGVGIVSAFGCDVERFWDALLAGESAARELALPGLPPVPAVTVDAFDAEEVVGRRELKRMDRVGAFAAVAAARALADAGDTGVDPWRFGASIACAHGGAATLDEAQATLRERGYAEAALYGDRELGGTHGIGGLNAMFVLTIISSCNS